MASVEGLLRLFGATETADRLNPEVAYKRGLMEEEARRKQAERDFFSNPQFLGQMNQVIPNAGQYLQQGGDVATLGTLAKLTTPKLTKFEENMQTLQALASAPPEVQDMYKGLFGKGGTTVNVGGAAQSPFQEKFQQNLGKQAAEQISKLDEEASDYASQVRSTEQALRLLQESPDLDISPFAPLTNTVKSALSDFLDEDALKNVSDYQTLDSQLIRNRFDVTKVLKGAITEQEQAAAQTVAGKPTGTREGLESTFKNNIAFGTLQADYAQRKRDYIQEQGENYSPKKFEQYYKELGERGERPTLDSLLGIASKMQPIKAGGKIKWSDF
jgi:hypothetical protein